MQYAIPASDLPAVPVAGGRQQFPVRHVFCVGRNYAEHAKEMGGDAAKEPPFFFTKAADAIVPVVPPAVGRIAYPMATRNLHHELELVVAIGRGGANVAAADAQALVFGYAVGLDMTRRDLQNEMREKKRPWDIGKSFAQAAPIAPISPVGETGVLTRGEVTL
ncbi:MAG TPA: fumarylacetoacetate hydrolase family protein, partial [Casimicrobiaceae bacterium]|nr:fumarylacetoacetate hydrolase family protein [Casimicrobiaceae bacterium]